MTGPRVAILLLAVAFALAAFGASRDRGGSPRDDTADDTTADAATTADGSTADDTTAEDTGVDGTADGGAPTFADAPPIPDRPVDEEALGLLDRYIASVGIPDVEIIEALGDTGDPRLLWVLSDILRLAFDPTTYEVATDAAARLSGLDREEDLSPFSWGPLTDHLIAWDMPAFDDYPAYKAAIYTVVEPAWQPFFDDADADIDWRLVSWGGVLIDDRPLGATGPCERGCIPSLDDPALTPAADGDWYPDDAIVFGVSIGGETVALPKNIMEVHEMVNATIGGRRVAIPYCTLCGAAQVFFTDVEGGGTGEIVMRTSGLLHRSNKVMYDLGTLSVFDTFTGVAVSGPLQDAGTRLDQATVVTTSWAQWRAAHPDTMIVARDGGIGRSYAADPLRGRDDDGPIFPIGERDDRLGVHEQVVGVVLGDGTTRAFPVAAAREVLQEGGEVGLDGVILELDAGGLVARHDGIPVASHQAFWFAWSQFHPATLLWEPSSS